VTADDVGAGARPSPTRPGLPALSALEGGLEPVTPTAPVPITRPVMLMDWRVLTYVHWRVAAADVDAMLPDGLRADTFDGSAWVGLVPFDMRDIRLPGMPRGIPWIGSFPETNIRTYVVGPDGGRGVWFHSLDITRAAAVGVARVGYQLPYMYADMSITRSGRRFRYRARRRWEGTPRSDVTVEVGPPVTPGERTPLDDFLANRWSLFANGPLGLVRARIDHEPWPLRHARVVALDDQFAAAAGYEVATPPDHVRFSPGVDVRVGLPSRVG
jgi:uncharacterized protein YqjF (DUF2071 family)